MGQREEGGRGRTEGGTHNDIVGLCTVGPTCTYKCIRTLI